MPSRNAKFFSLFFSYNFLFIYLEEADLEWNVLKDKENFNCHANRNNGKLFAGSLGSTYAVEKCKEKCKTYSNCGTIEVFERGWCFIFSNDITCVYSAEPTQKIIILQFTGGRNTYV